MSRTNDNATLPWVLRMAKAMEHKLQLNRHKGNREGWQKQSAPRLVAMLMAEVVELADAVAAVMEHESKPEAPQLDPSIEQPRAAVRKEAADVCNVAMMLADVMGDLASFSDAHLGTLEVVTPCPGCGRQTLFVDSDGLLSCSHHECRGRTVSFMVDELRARLLLVEAELRRFRDGAVAARQSGQQRGDEVLILPKPFAGCEWRGRVLESTQQLSEPFVRTMLVSFAEVKSS